MAVKIKISLRAQVMQKSTALGRPIPTPNKVVNWSLYLAGDRSVGCLFQPIFASSATGRDFTVDHLLVVFPLDWVSGLVFLVTAPLIPFFMALVGKTSENETKKQWKAISRLGADFLDTLQGLTTLKLLGRVNPR